MKMLVAEDDSTSRLLLEVILKEYGTVQSCANGREAVVAFRNALEAGQPYNLVCLDIMMPEMDGKEALRQIRAIENSRGISSTQGVKTIMITALGDVKNMFEAYKELCDAYVVKPVQKNIFLEELRKLGLIA
jgi:two-component system chemotaxis response regulator CheY